MNNSHFDYQHLFLQAQSELRRINSRLDKLAVPTKNIGGEMSVIGRLDWLIKHYNINVDDLSHYERMQRLNSDISNDLVGGE